MNTKNSLVPTVRYSVQSTNQNKANVKVPLP